MARQRVRTQPPPDRSLLIVGATARAAAHSARYAGFEPLAVDTFADTDLEACCPVIRLRDYPQGLVAATEGFPGCPWLYTGALENHPELIGSLSAKRRLLGNPSSVLNEVRNPWRLARALQKENLRYPHIRCLGSDTPQGAWLRKPIRSAGGQGITVSSQRSPSAEGETRESRRRYHERSRGPQGCLYHSERLPLYYLQERIFGESYAAVYVAAKGQALLLGVTRQLIGCSWSGAVGFRYAGSIGPATLTPELRDEFVRIGTSLARHFRLLGLFGVDVVLDGEGIWTVEVNPRYTASVEVLERSLGIPSMAWHVAACCDGVLPVEPDSMLGQHWGKAILFARRQLRITSKLHDFVERANAASTRPLVADVPKCSDVVLSGRPILTVFATGPSLGQVEDGLRNQASHVEAILGNTASATGAES